MEKNNKESFKWFLDVLNQKATKGRFELVEKRIEGLKGVSTELSTTVDCTELHLDLNYLENDVIVASPFRKIYHLNCADDENTFYNQFYEDCTKVAILGTSNNTFKSISDLVRYGSN